MPAPDSAAAPDVSASDTDVDPEVLSSPEGAPSSADSSPNLDADVPPRTLTSQDASDPAEKAAADGMESRSNGYAEAHLIAPGARSAEIQHMLHLVDPQYGQSILDYGCGTGVLTFPLSRSVSPDGIVHAVEDKDGFIRESVAQQCRAADNVQVLLAENGTIPVDDASVDAICTLATLHHVPDKLKLFREFSRVLKVGGRLVIGDVARNTNVQRFFDEHVDAFCSTGHDHKFLGCDDVRYFCSRSSLSLQHFKVRNVPWGFNSEEEAAQYLTSIFDLSCEADYTLDRAQRYVGYTRAASQFTLLWRLFFFVGVKRDEPFAPLR